MTAGFKPKAGDYVLIVFLLLICILPAILFVFHDHAKSVGYEISISDKLVYKGDLSLDTTLCYDVAYGKAVIEVANGKIRMQHSCCPEQICVHAGWTSSPLSPIICVPNKILIKITGKTDKDSYDAILR